ncbi:MAG: hypothetical protein WC869_11270 [Phycisphaerae bacterium]|jgi:hypothetical protein
MKTRLIPARFKGRCRVCGKEVLPGQNVYFAKHYGVRCEACGPHTDADAPLPSKRKASSDKKPSPSTPSGKKRRKAAPEASPDTGAMPGEKVAQRYADGVTRYEFGSVTEAVRDALDDYAQNDSSAEYLRRRQGYALSGKDRWGNNFTRSRFLRELSAPSKHLLDAVDLMRQRLVGEVAAPDAPRRRIRRGQEWGEELDADRWLVRDLSPWERSVRESQPRRTVTIGCNLSVNAGAQPNELLYRGAAALALADILTSRGVNVGVVLFYSARDVTSTVSRAVVRYTVKDPLMPLDVSAVAFAMCEIAFFRVVGALGSPRHFTGVLNESLGQAANLPVADRLSIDFLVDADVLGEQAAEGWLRGCLAGSESEVCYV